MKKLFIVVFLFIIINNIQAQSYIKMIDTTNIWDALCGGITTNGDDCRQTDKLQFIGDTIINDTIYHKFYSKTQFTLNDSALQYIGALREDTLQQKIYRRNCLNSPTTEGLIYDFSLMPGDSILLAVDYYNRPNPIKVDSINLENFAGRLRRKIFITSYTMVMSEWWSYQYQWIEGIGKVFDEKIKGPIYQVNPGVDDDNINPSVDELLCFWQSGQMLYQNPYYLSCLIIHVDILEIDHLENNLIYPNPTKKILTIEMQNKTEPISLSVFNINGQELIKRQIINNMTQLDISYLPNGVYFIKLLSDKIIEVRKVIKE